MGIKPTLLKKYCDICPDKERYAWYHSEKLPGGGLQWFVDCSKHKCTMIEQIKRDAEILVVYPGWVQVNRMPENQIVAIYRSLQKRGTFDGRTSRSGREMGYITPRPEPDDSYHQITVGEYIRHLEKRGEEMDARLDDIRDEIDRLELKYKEVVS